MKNKIMLCLVSVLTVFAVSCASTAESPNSPSAVSTATATPSATDTATIAPTAVQTRGAGFINDYERTDHANWVNPPNNGTYYIVSQASWWNGGSDGFKGSFAGNGLAYGMTITVGTGGTVAPYTGWVGVSEATMNGAVGMDYTSASSIKFDYNYWMATPPADGTVTCRITVIGAGSDYIYQDFTPAANGTWANVEKAFYLYTLGPGVSTYNQVLADVRAFELTVRMSTSTAPGDMTVRLYWDNIYLMY